MFTNKEYQSIVWGGQWLDLALKIKKLLINSLINARVQRVELREDTQKDWPR